MRFKFELHGDQNFTPPEASKKQWAALDKVQRKGGFIGSEPGTNPEAKGYDNIVEFYSAIAISK